MKLLSNKEVELLQHEFDYIVTVSGSPRLDSTTRATLFERAKEIRELLDNSKHTGVDFELKLVKGGRA